MNQISLPTQIPKTSYPQAIPIPSPSLSLSQQQQQQQENYQRVNTLSALIKNNQTQELRIYLNQNQSQIPPSIFSYQLLTFIESNHQNPEILSLLLMNHAEVNLLFQTAHYPQGITILMYSIQLGNLSLFNVIMNYHPDILLQDGNQWNAVVYAILFNEENNHFFLLKLLTRESILSTAVIDNTTHNLLTLATRLNKKKFVDILLKANIDINYQTNPEGDTALHIAVKLDQVEIGEMLLKCKNCNRKLKNKEMKTVMDLAKERKGKVYYQLFNKQAQGPGPLVPGQGQGGSQGVVSSQGISQTESQSQGQSQRESKFKSKKAKSLYIPIDLKDDNLSSLIEISNTPKLYVSINNNTIDKISSQLLKTEEIYKDKLNMIKRLEMSLAEKEAKIQEMLIGIEHKDAEILKYKSSTNQQKINLSELLGQSNEISQYLANQSNPNNQFNFLSKKYENINYKESYIIKCLQNDLIDYQAYVKEIIEHKRPLIDELINNIQVIVNDINPDYEVKLYGSYATGLCLPWSDLDVVLINTATPTIDDFMLSKLYAKLIGKPWIKTHKYIENTSIPIIKLESVDYYQFAIDISIQNDKHMGLKCVELVKCYLTFYSVLEPIVLALKTLLNNGNLNNPYKGGLSSYGLILMVVSFIQSEIENQNTMNEANNDLLGKTFLNVLGHYGICFDFDKYVILAYPVNNAINQNEKDTNFPFGSNQHELIIVDPLNKQNNVAKSTFNYMSIKMAFMIAYMVAREDCECGCHYHVLQNRHFTIEHCILKRIFNSVKRFSEANKPLY